MNITLGKAITLAIASAALSSLITAAVVKKDAAPKADTVAEKKEPAAVHTDVIVSQGVTDAKPADAAAKPEATPAVAEAKVTVTETRAAPADSIDVKMAMADRSIGKPDAPVTIIEYASMTCDHCAAFHNDVLPAIKEELIETGKARLVFRDMPWDGPALKAAKMARCAAPEKYFELVGQIFKQHDDWAHAKEPLIPLKEIGVEAGGMSEPRILACLDSEALETEMLQAQKTAREEHKIKGTPHFVFMSGDEKMESYPEFEEISKRLVKEHKHD